MLIIVDCSLSDALLYAMGIVKKQRKAILLGDELFVFCWSKTIIYVKFR